MRIGVRNGKAGYDVVSVVSEQRIIGRVVRRRRGYVGQVGAVVSRPHRGLWPACEWVAHIAGVTA